MPKQIDDKPLTIKDIREVLIPAMEEVFATKKDLDRFATKEDMESIRLELENFITREEFNQFKDQSLTNQDRIIKDLEALTQENTMQFSQNRRFSDDFENHEKRLRKLELKVKAI